MHLMPLLASKSSAAGRATVLRYRRASARHAVGGEDVLPTVFSTRPSKVMAGLVPAIHVLLEL
jgi:hypothetical protein